MATPIPANRASFVVSDMVTATRGTSALAHSSPTVTSITTDSRAVVPNGAFVALRGASMDGHRFVASAASRGAALVVVERASLPAVLSEVQKARDVRRVHDAAISCGVLAVDDTLVAWGDLARLHLEAWRAKDTGRRVVAITGSAGKTTTKELTAALLSEVDRTHFTAGNLNNRIGLPAVVFGLSGESDGHRFAVLEMGMSVPGEIDAMAHVARPDVAIVTNVLVAHAEGVGGREGVMHEKGGVYRALDARGVAIVNADDDFVVRASNVDTRFGTRITFGRAPSADVRIVDREPLGARGSRLVLSRGGRGGPEGTAFEVHLPLPGEAAAIDFAAALGAAEAASGVVFDVERMHRALSRVHLEGRANVVSFGESGVLLDDTYNANPGSMRAALATLAEIAEGRRRVVVLGEMKELGALAEEEHRALGDAVAQAGVDLAIGCGGLISLTLERAASLGVDVVAANSTDEAASAAVRRITPKDAVLVKGSRSVGTERVVARLSESWPISSESASSDAHAHDSTRGRGRST